jgi:hypothetical protein
MRDHIEDTDRNFRTIFFIAIFSLFVLVFLNNQEYHSSSTRYTAQTEFVFGNNSIHHNTIITNGVWLPDIQIFSECAFNKTNLNPFSIPYKISEHNRRIAQNFIQIEKTRLTIEPLLLWRLHFNPSFNDKEDLPVLG